LNQVADALSRAPLSAEDTPADDHVEEKEVTQYWPNWDGNKSPLSPIEKIGKDNIHLCKCEVKLCSAEICVKFSSNSDTSSENSEEFLEEGEEEIEQDQTLYSALTELLNEIPQRNGFKAVVPRSLIRRVMFACHGHPLSEHAGISKTIHRTKQIYYWPKMSRHIRVYVRSCQHCQQYKPNQTPYVPHNMTYPWETICVDLCGPKANAKGNLKWILIIIDQCTKYVELFPLAVASAKKIVEKINEYYMGRHRGKCRHVSKHAYRDRRYESTDSSSISESSSSERAHRKRCSKKSASKEPRTPKEVLTGTTPATSHPLAQIQFAPRNQIRMEPVVESAPSVSSVEEPKEPMPEEAIDWNGPKNSIQIELMKRPDDSSPDDYTPSVPNYLLPKDWDVNRPNEANAPPPAGYHPSHDKKFVATKKEDSSSKSSYAAAAATPRQQRSYPDTRRTEIEKANKVKQALKERREKCEREIDAGIPHENLNLNPATQIPCQFCGATGWCIGCGPAFDALQCPNCKGTKIRNRSASWNSDIVPLLVKGVKRGEKRIWATCPSCKVMYSSRGEAIHVYPRMLTPRLTPNRLKVIPPQSWLPLEISRADWDTQTDTESEAPSGTSKEASKEKEKKLEVEDTPPTEIIVVIPYEPPQGFFAGRDHPTGGQPLRTGYHRIGGTNHLVYPTRIHSLETSGRKFAESSRIWKILLEQVGTTPDKDIDERWYAKLPTLTSLYMRNCEIRINFTKPTNSRHVGVEFMNMTVVAGPEKPEGQSYGQNLIVSSPLGPSSNRYLYQEWALTRASPPFENNAFSLMRLARLNHDGRGIPFEFHNRLLPTNLYFFFSFLSIVVHLFECLQLLYSCECNNWNRRVSFHRNARNTGVSRYHVVSLICDDHPTDERRYSQDSIFIKPLYDS
uniref:RNA-directed DNA polymerase n=1 Tax=Strigamia maritima TaxID=126957 RepID=T1IH97_STRMM